MLSKKQTTVQKSPEKTLTKTSLYKMTMQKQQEKGAVFSSASMGSSKRNSNKPSKERNQLQQSTQMSQASFNQSIQSSAQNTHRRSKTGILNSCNYLHTYSHSFSHLVQGITSTLGAGPAGMASNSYKPSANNSYQRSRENSQSNRNMIISNATANFAIASQAHLIP